MELQVAFVFHSSDSNSDSDIMSASSTFASLALKQSRILHSYACVRPPLNLCRTCFYRTNTGNALLKNRTSVSLENRESFNQSKWRVLASSARTFASGNNDDNEKAITQESTTKKQLKSEDLLRILSLAKPEYKSIAGKQEFLLSV